MSVEVPVLYIQCDWDSFVFKNNGTAWVSCKSKGSPSQQGKLRGRGTHQPYSEDDEFNIVSFTTSTITIKHSVSNSLCMFVAPHKIFSNIHNKSVVSVNVSSGGLGVSVCADNQLRVWDCETGQVRKTLDGHVFDVYKCRFFPSGLVVLSSGAAMQLKIWSAETGQCAVTLKGHKASVTDFCIVDKGRNVISVSKDGTARLWDCGKANCIRTLYEQGSAINCCALGEMSDCWELQPREGDVSDREVGTGDKLLVVGREDGVLCGVCVFNNQVVFTIDLQAPVSVVTWASKVHVVTGCQDGSVCVNDVRTVGVGAGELQSVCVRLNESNSAVCSICTSGHGVFIGRNDGSLTYYHLPDLSTDSLQPDTKRLQLTGSDCDPIYDVCFMSDFVYSACRDGLVRKYHVTTAIRELFNAPLE